MAHPDARMQLSSSHMSWGCSLAHAFSGTVLHVVVASNVGGLFSGGFQSIGVHPVLIHGKFSDFP